MTASDRPDAGQERANALYWNSEETVDSVAGQLGITRSALYSAVRPLSAGADCPDCGSGLVYPNRSSRTTGRPMCLACERTFNGADLEGGAAGGYAGWRDEHPQHHEHEGHDTGYDLAQARLRRWREDLAAVEPQRAVMIGGAAALGVLFGVAATALLRRRG